MQLVKQGIHADAITGYHANEGLTRSQANKWSNEAR